MDNNENIKVKSINVVVDGKLIKQYIVTDREKVLLEKSVFALEHSVKSVHREILQSIKDEDELKKRLEKSLVGVVHWWIKINDDLTLNVTEEPNGLYHVSLSGKFIGNIEGSYTLIDKLIFDEFKKKKDDKTYLSTILLNKIYGLKNVDPLRISIENIIKAKKINKSTFM
ncbi:hypothetical protein ACOTWR_11825 [Aliarcobacter butzleri]